MPSSANTSATASMTAPPITQAMSAAGPAVCAAYMAENSQPEPMTLPMPVATSDQ